MKFSSDFYILNKDQHFAFPHTNCDELETDYVKDLFFQDYGKHCFRYFGGEDIEQIKTDTDIGEFGAAFMRMKFIAEVTDPTRLFRRFMKKKPKGFLVGEIAEIWEWETEGMDRYSHIDTLTNRICNAMLEMIRANVRNTGIIDVPDIEELRIIVKHLNTELPKVRKAKCGEFMWSDTAPYELFEYPYFILVVRFWKIIHATMLRNVEQVAAESVVLV